MDERTFNKAMAILAALEEEINKAADIIEAARKKSPRILEFGYGKILVGYGTLAGSPSLRLHPTEKVRPVGAIPPEYAPLNDQDILLTFDNVESLDVVIDNLMELREKYFGGEDE